MVGPCPRNSGELLSATMNQPAPIIIPTKVPSPPVPTRPRLLDYLFLLAGCGLSCVLADLSGLQTAPRATPPTPILEVLLRRFPFFLFLPLGVVLLWPLLFATQTLCGRRQGLTAGEWLWGLSWIAALFFIGWIVGHYLGLVPEFLATQAFREKMILGYVLYGASTSVIALLILLVDLVRRQPRPWTHGCALALMFWPVFPLAALWFGNIQLQ